MHMCWITIPGAGACSLPFLRLPPATRRRISRPLMLRGTSSSATSGIVPPLGIQSVVWGGNTKYPKVVFIDLWGIGDCSPLSVFSPLCGV